jgi:hypothetical protein
MVELVRRQQYLKNEDDKVNALHNKQEKDLGNVNCEQLFQEKESVDQDLNHTLCNYKLEEIQLPKDNIDLTNHNLNINTKSEDNSTKNKTKNKSSLKNNSTATSTAISIVSQNQSQKNKNVKLKNKTNNNIQTNKDEKNSKTVIDKS